MIVMLSLVTVPFDQLQAKVEESLALDAEEASINNLKSILTAAHVSEEEISKTLIARYAALAQRRTVLCTFHDVEAIQPAAKDEGSTEVKIKPKRTRRAPAASAPVVAEGEVDTGWKVRDLDANLYPTGSWLADLRTAMMGAKQYKPEFQPVIDQLVQASRDDAEGYFPIGLIAQRFNVGNKTQLITGAINEGLAATNLGPYKLSKEEKGGRRLVRLDYAALATLKG